MKKKFIIATGNKNKVKELNRMLESLDIEAVAASEVGIDIDNVVEDGNTFKENSYKKAIYAYNICQLPVIADDSGLCVDALNGEPGIYSARYAGENATDRDKCQKILNNMKDVPFDKRSAHFHSAITCILSDNDIISVEGICDGDIAFDFDGDGGFGYDPIFIYQGHTFASMDPEYKDKNGHRGRALRMLYQELEKRFGE